jgi:hypothetical protein
LWWFFLSNGISFGRRVALVRFYGSMFFLACICFLRSAHLAVPLPLHNFAAYWYGFGWWLGALVLVVVASIAPVIQIVGQKWFVSLWSMSHRVIDLWFRILLMVGLIAILKSLNSYGFVSSYYSCSYVHHFFILQFGFRFVYRSTRLWW